MYNVLNKYVNVVNIMENMETKTANVVRAVDTTKKFVSIEILDEKREVVGKYFGEYRMLNNTAVAYGFGICKYHNGFRYCGQWKNNRRCGEGISINDSNIYIGKYLKDKKEGKGFILYNNGEKYFGDLSAGMKNGFGIYVFKQNNIYIGNWLSGSMTGKGGMFYENKDIYVGNWLMNKKNDRGTYYYNDEQTKFVGYWKENEKFLGEVYVNDVLQYSGYWKNGVKHWVGTEKDGTRNYYFDGVVCKSKEEFYTKNNGKGYIDEVELKVEETRIKDNKYINGLNNLKNLFNALVEINAI